MPFGPTLTVTPFLSGQRAWPDVAPIGTAAAARRLPAWCAAWSFGKRPPRSGFLAVGFFCTRVSGPCQQGLATTTFQDAPGDEAHDEHCRDSRNLPGSRQKPFSANTGLEWNCMGQFRHQPIGRLAACGEKNSSRRREHEGHSKRSPVTRPGQPASLPALASQDCLPSPRHR